MSDLLEKKWEEVKNIINYKFPDEELSFGYGSGVFHQNDYDYSKNFPMIDIIFVVKDVKLWHEENLKRNPSHYSGNFQYL